MRDECIICLDSEGQITTNICECKTVRYHKKCLFKWINIKRKYKCEICDNDYDDRIVNEYINNKRIDEKLKKHNTYLYLFMSIFICSITMFVIFYFFVVF